MTNKEKAAIFILYANASIKTFNGSVHLMSGVVDFVDSGWHVSFIKDGKNLFKHINDCQLILKDLSKTADEDKTEIAKILGADRAIVGDNFLQTAGDDDFVGRHYNLTGSLPIALIDFLRSQNYALPYAGQSLFELKIAVEE